jgi:hypothetical protein
MTFHIAEVRNFEDDPTKSGRVKVRIYNKHNDEQQVKDDELPWAMVLHPVTSPATSRIGISPSGLVVGSRVLIIYSEEDHAKQYPIVIGSLARGDMPEGHEDSNGGVGTNTDDAKKNSGGKIKKPGIDNPAWTKKDSN